MTVRQELWSTINLLERHNIKNVEILFGFAWGNEYQNWTPYIVDVSSIESEISKAEALKVGFIGDDDFYITHEGYEIEILFCHECDIHLSFNQSNEIVNDILKDWQEKNIISPR